MKRNIKTSKTNLEDKIVELSLKNKRLSAELEAIKNDNCKVINTLIHNLKNPVGSSFSFSEMLVENSAIFDEEKTTKYLSIIKNSSQYAIEILNAFAKLNSLKSTNFELNIRNENYNSFISNSIEFSKNKYADNNVSFNVNVEDNIYCNFDKTELKYVIDQLINNAVRFSENNATISVNVKKNDTKIITTITDHGIGFEAENATKLFNEFYVENTYDVYQKKCLGLGLTFVKKIINLHKGSVTILNNLPTGTTVQFVLPA